MLPKLSLDKKILTNIERSKKLEWIVTNGLGGYASSTVIGMNTRKYHGLFIGGDVENRKVLLSKLEEEVFEGNKTVQLSTNS